MIFAYSYRRLSKSIGIFTKMTCFRNDKTIPNLSHRNHFRFGYNGEWFGDRSSPSDNWSVRYGRCSRPPADFRTECINTAKLIHMNADNPIWIFFSGGIDSEIVVQSFLFARVPFHIAITRFSDQKNRHDIAYAVKFCERHNIFYRFLDLDIETFFHDGRAMKYAQLTRCVQPQLLHTMWAMDQVDGFPVLGSGECLLVRDETTSKSNTCAPVAQWSLYEKERIASWYRYLIERRRNGCAGFFQYTPEIMLSFLVDPGTRQSVSQPYDDNKELKHTIYSQHFLIEPRPKFHGFERIMHIDGIYRPLLEASFNDWNQIYKTPYDQLLNYLAFSNETSKGELL